MPHTVELSEKYRLVAEANRRMYDEAEASAYSHDVLASRREQAMMEHDLRRALARLPDLGRPVVALDCCGGAGNAALKLQELGCETTLVDISAPMIARYREECARRGYAEPRTHCGEVAAYLADSPERFDLIVFSSALHHLEDPAMVLRLARAALREGGLIVTMFDNLRLSRRAKAVLEPARLADSALRNPRAVVRRAAPVVRRLLRGGGGYKQRAEHLELTPDNVGNIAEYHADTGLDADALARGMEQSGMRLVHLDRYITAAGPLRTVLLRALRIPTSFKMLLRKDSR